MSVDDLSKCTLETCPISEYGLLDYLPSLAGNALYIAIFAIVIPPQLYLGLRHKTWGYLVGMTCGLILEVLGYISRILLRNDIFSISFFVMNICCLTIGPRILLRRNLLIAFTFVTCDIVSMSLQAVGGAITSSNPNNKLGDQGVDIMIAGLASQVATTVAFCAICIAIARNIRKHPDLLSQDATSLNLRQKPTFRLFLAAITIGTLTILIRCCYRLAELSQGYNTAIANDQVSFMVLEGAMMIICVVARTVGHPGPVLRETWLVGKFRFSELKKNPLQSSRPKLHHVTAESSGFDSDRTLSGDQKIEKVNV